MKVRRAFFFVLPAIALLLHSGCGGGNAMNGDEASDPLFQRAEDLKRQGRNEDALNAFLKEIERRGENGAPESHLEAGALYLSWAKDPVEAYHHFSMYLQLRPTGPRAEMVQGQREAAERELARTLHAPPEDRTAQLEANARIEELERQVHELQAENDALRGGSPAVSAARRPPMITLSDDDVGSPVSPAESPIVAAPGSVAPAIPEQSPMPRPVTSRPAAAPKTPGGNAAGTFRTHTVAQRESLWSIARHYYGSQTTGARVRAIYNANRDVMRSETDLRAGMVLKIP